METKKWSLNDFSNVLSQDQMKSVKGGTETWECTCGGTSWNGYGTNGDLREELLTYCEGGSIPAYCTFQ